MPARPGVPHTTIRGHEDLLVWQESMSLVEDAYRCTANFPSHERYGLVSQIRRSAVSVASNIAEGAARRTTAELVHFLYVARGSLAELETQLEIGARLGYLGESHRPNDKIGRVGKLLNGLINRLKRP